LELNRNVSEYFAETEQVAFCTSHIVPGIDFSEDPLLQGRNFSYQDTQLTRLGGPNFTELPINQPICPVLNNNRDGFMKHYIHPGKFNYYPNRATAATPLPGNAVNTQGKNGPSAITYSDAVEEQKAKDAFHTNSYIHYAAKMEGLKIRLRGPKFQEHFRQARLFYNSLSKMEKEHLIAAAQFELGHVDDFGVRQRMVDRFNVIDHTLATRVANAIGVSVPGPLAADPKGEPAIKVSAPLSQLSMPGSTIAGRKIAFLLADGYDAGQLQAIMAATKAKMCVNQVVSIRKGTIFSAGAKRSMDQKDEEDANFSRVKAVWSIWTTKSVLFDAVVIVDGVDSVTGLSSFGESIAFVAEAFKHQKPILAIGAGTNLLLAAQLHVLSSVKLAGSDGGKEMMASQGVVTVPVWSAIAPSSLLTATASAATAVGHALGKEMDLPTPNKAIQAFIENLTNHRAWDRDVLRVPA